HGSKPTHSLSRLPMTISSDRANTTDFYKQHVISDDPRHHGINSLVRSAQQTKGERRARRRGRCCEGEGRNTANIAGRVASPLRRAGNVSSVPRAATPTEAERPGATSVWRPTSRAQQRNFAIPPGSTAKRFSTTPA